MKAYLYEESNAIQCHFIDSFHLQLSSILGRYSTFADDFEKGEDSQIYQYRTAHGFSVEIVPKKGVNKSKALKVKYVSIFKGSARVKGFFKLAQKATEVSLSYDVYFNGNFQFVKGGKLHGVGPDLAITGGRKMQPHGWSSRVMFRKEGRVETYLYTQDKNQKFGAEKQNEAFHGGGTSAWAPKDKNGNHVNVHATFDNFVVTEGLKIKH